MTGSTATREELLKAINDVDSRVGTLHNQINTIAQREAQAAASGITSVSRQQLKEQLIKASAALIDRAANLHDQLCNLP